MNRYSLKRVWTVLGLLAALMMGCRAMAGQQVVAPQSTETARALMIQTLVSTMVATPTSRVATLQPPPTSTPADPSPPLASSTPAFQLATATLPPDVQPATLTPVVVARSTGTPTLTPPPEHVYYSHPEIPEFLFPADPSRWKKLQLTDANPYIFLEHQTLPGCKIDAVPGRGIGTPTRVMRWPLGRLYWRIYDYQSSALAGISRPSWLYLEISGYQNPDCRADLRTLMTHVVMVDEVTGKRPYDPLPTATPRPELAGFACPNNPPTRLRSGDYVHIVTKDLLLRSQPRADASTRIRSYSEGDPIYIEIIDGPVCEKFIYWKVRLGMIGEGAPEPVTGWLAEGDLREYFLELGE